MGIPHNIMQMFMKLIAIGLLLAVCSADFDDTPVPEEMISEEVDSTPEDSLVETSDTATNKASFWGRRRFSWGARRRSKPKPKPKPCGPLTRQFCRCGRVMKGRCPTNHCKKCKPGSYGGRPKPIRRDGSRGRYMEKQRKKAKKAKCGPTTRQFCRCGRVMKGRCPTNHCKKCKPGSYGGRPKPIRRDGNRGR